MGNGDLRSEGAFLGGLRGAGPALAGIVREVRAFALSRFGEIGCCDPMIAAVQPRCRRCVVGGGKFSGARGIGPLDGLLGCVAGVLVFFAEDKGDWDVGWWL